MVDAADHEKLDGAKNELHSLLDKPQLSGIPVRGQINFYVVKGFCGYLLSMCKVEHVLQCNHVVLLVHMLN